MPRDRQSAGNCPQCGQGNYTCSYNVFQNDQLRIDSWEHKCPDCGHRETAAYRSDAEEKEEGIDPEVCPFCGRTVATDS